MNEDKNFDKRNALRAELAELMSGLSVNTSPIGDWKVIKVYEARILDKEDPYDIEELSSQRQAARDRINEIQEELRRIEND